MTKNVHLIFSTKAFVLKNWNQHFWNAQQLAAERYSNQYEKWIGFGAQFWVDISDLVDGFAAKHPQATGTGIHYLWLSEE